MTNILAMATDGSLAEVDHTSATKAISLASDGSLTEIVVSGTQKVLALASDGSLREVSVTFGGRTASYLGTSRAVGASPKTISSVDIGSPASDRLIVVALTVGNDGQSSGALATVSVGGVSLTRAVGQNSDGWNTAYIFYGIISSGSVADLVIGGYGGNVSSVLAAHIYALTGLTSTTPYAVASVNHAAQTNLNVPASGILIGCSGGWDSAGGSSVIYTTSNALQTADNASEVSSGNWWATYSGHSTGLSATSDYSVRFVENGSNTGWNYSAIASWQ